MPERGPEVLVITAHDDLITVFRALPRVLGRPVRVHQYPTLTHPHVLAQTRVWALLCLDLRTIQREAGEAWRPLFRRLIQRYPAMKWVALAPQAHVRPAVLPSWVRFHRVLTPPWVPETLAQALKPLLFPTGEVQAALNDGLALLPRPAWLNHPEIVRLLRDVVERIDPVRGTGWWEYGFGALVWYGDALPASFSPLNPPADGHTLDHLAWWRAGETTYWFYAVPVYQQTWLATWGESPCPYQEIHDHLHSLRDALWHMEPPKAEEGLPAEEEGEEEEFPPEEPPMPLFDDVPPPFPYYPFP